MIVLNTIGAMTFDNIPDITLPDNFSRVLELLEQHRDDGIVLFEGGGDIPPLLYNEQNTHTRLCDFEYDRLRRELSIYTVARSLNMRMFGICRGHQLLATLEGSSLYQDLFYDAGVSHAWTHRIRTTDYAPQEIKNVLTDIGFRVNSLHHQAVKCLGAGNMPVAFSEDGILESFINPGARIFGVQWHPELMGHTQLLKAVYELL